MKHNLRTTSILLLLFFLSQLIGIGVISRYTKIPAIENSKGVSEYNPLPFNMGRLDIDQNKSPIYIAAGVIIGTIILFFMLKYKLEKVWKGWYLLAVVIALMITLNPFIGDRWALVLAAIFGIWKVFRPGVIIHNLTEIFIYAGIAVIFVPVLNIFSASILLILISLYDAYAVWKSKHMIKLAKMQGDTGIFAGLFIPYDNILAVKKQDKSVVHNVKKKIDAGILGGGDLAFPLLFSGVIMNNMGLWSALIVIITSTLSLMGLLFFSKKSRFYPAMPFISAGLFFGFLITYVINHML